MSESPGGGWKVSVARRTRKESFICQSDDQGGHQRLVRGGVQDGPEHGTHVEAPSDPAVELQTLRTPCQIPSRGENHVDLLLRGGTDPIAEPARDEQTGSIIKLSLDDKVA